MSRGKGAYGYGETGGHVDKIMTMLLIKFRAVQLQLAVCQLQ